MIIRNIRRQVERLAAANAWVFQRPTSVERRQFRADKKL
jgi:hypothetical protein